jgi:aquaporin NIP
MKLFPLAIAEFIGTYFMVFFGCGAIIHSHSQVSLSPDFIPIIFGAAVSIMIYAVGHISGAHFNPAVSFAFWITRKIDIKKLSIFILAQSLGAIAASATHLQIWPDTQFLGMTYLSISDFNGFIVEVILSFCLMFVITSVATDSRAIGELAGIAIGTTVAVCAFIGGPVTGASMNPARSLAPALLSGNFDSLWIYFVAPCVGATLGAIVYNFIKCHKVESKSKHGCC